jgi:hypothetical protein
MGLGWLNGLIAKVSGFPPVPISIAAFVPKIVSDSKFVEKQHSTKRQGRAHM